MKSINKIYTAIYFLVYIDFLKVFGLPSYIKIGKLDDVIVCCLSFCCEDKENGNGGGLNVMLSALLKL